MHGHKLVGVWVFPAGREFRVGKECQTITDGQARVVESVDTTDYGGVQITYKGGCMEALYHTPVAFLWERAEDEQCHNHSLSASGQEEKSAPTVSPAASTSNTAPKAGKLTADTSTRRKQPSARRR